MGFQCGRSCKPAIMASKSLISNLLLASFLLLATQFATGSKTLKISHELSDALLKKGYFTMSLFAEEQILQQMLEISEPKNTTITLFCPLDKAFHSLNYGGPPFTLLQYQAVPSKISREVLESSPSGLKINTLLHGHPLVKTTIPHGRKVSINNVKIIDWDVYNDGNVIVHGAESFFDPAFPILYPVDQEDFVTSREEVPSQRSSIKVVLDSTKLFLFVGSIIFLAFFCFLLHLYSKKDEDDYLPLSTK